MQCLFGWTLALVHALHVGLAMRSLYIGYMLYPYLDLKFHGFGFLGIDAPVALVVLGVLRIFGIGYGEELWPTAVGDSLILVVGTAYWFAVGYFLSPVVLSAPSRLSRIIKDHQLATWAGIRMAALLAMLALVLTVTPLWKFIWGLVVLVLVLMWVLVLPAVVVVGLARRIVRRPSHC
jgi:hypothetical protein